MKRERKEGEKVGLADVTAMEVNWRTKGFKREGEWG